MPRDVARQVNRREAPRTGQRSNGGRNREDVHDIALRRYAAVHGEYRAKLLALYCLAKARDPFLMEWLQALRTIEGRPGGIGPVTAEEIAGYIERRLEGMA